MHTRLKYLVDKYLQNTLTEQEKAELLSGLNLPENDAELLSVLEEKWQQKDFVSRKLSATDSDSILQNIFAATQEQPEVHGKIIRIVPWWRLSVAIILILLCVTGAYLYLTSKEAVTGVTLAKNQAPLSDSAKRGHLATLTLSDGSKVLVTETKAGVIAQDGELLVSNKADVVSYSIKAAAKNTPSDLQRLNTFTTKKGQEYSIVLPDGSQVWLNGSSAITFPVAFKSDERTVSLTGEALFKVTKDASRPFKVATQGPTIEVLGTYFNVNAYSNEPQVKTTLIEGSVALRNGLKSVLMHPGQQGMLNNQGEFELINLQDAERAVSWKEGNLDFVNDSLSTVLRQISRWYDIEIDDQTTQPVNGFSGKVPKNLSLDELKEFFTGYAKIRFTGKKMVVTDLG